MKGLELVADVVEADVEAVRREEIRDTPEERAALFAGDGRDRGEDVGSVCAGALVAVDALDVVLGGLGRVVDGPEAVVEPLFARGHVAAEDGRVRREDGRDGELGLADEGDGEAAEPLVEVGDDTS